MNDAKEKQGRITGRVVLFTQEDAVVFIHMLDNPRAPNAALTKAYERYNDKVEKGAIRNAKIGSPHAVIPSCVRYDGVQHLTARRLHAPSEI